MKISRSGDYGINGLVYFARKGEGAVAYVREVSEALHIPESFLAKIFQAFVRAGILLSRRGVRGGYSLARPAHSITLREVIEAAQGPIALNRCMLARRPCGRHRRCGLHEVLRAAQRTVVQKFEHATLGSLARTTR